MKCTLKNTITQKGSAIMQALLVVASTGLISGAIGFAVVRSSKMSSLEDQKKLSNTAGESISMLLGAQGCSDGRLQYNLANGPTNTLSPSELISLSASGSIPMRLKTKLPGQSSEAYVPSESSDLNKVPKFGVQIDNVSFQMDSQYTSQDLSQDLANSSDTVNVPGKLTISFKAINANSDMKSSQSSDIVLNLKKSTGEIAGCKLGVSSENFCKQIGGKYNSKSSPRCQFVPPDTSECAEQGMYIKDYNTDGKPVCATFEATCPRGYFIRSITSTGRAVCEYTSVSPTPPPTGVLKIQKEINFVAAAPIKKVDILMVIDNSGSMKLENAELSQKFSNFVNLLEEAGLDWQACYTTTGVGPAFTDGNVMPWISQLPSDKSGAPPLSNLNVLTANNDLKHQYMLASLGQFSGGGSGDEQGIRSISKSLDAVNAMGCFRSDSALNTIIVSDEDEHSCGGRCELSGDAGSARKSSSYRDQYRTMGPTNQPEALIQKVANKFGSNHKFIAHSLVIKSGDTSCFKSNDEKAPAFYGKTYEKLSGLTNGIVGSVCSPDYANDLKDMASKTIQLISVAAKLECDPESIDSIITTPYVAGLSHSVNGLDLSITPSVPEGTKVKVNYTCK